MDDVDSETAAMGTAFSAADIDFIHHLLETLRRDIVHGRDYGGLLTIISRRLDSFQEAVTTAAVLEVLPHCAPLVCTVTRDESAGGPSKIRITGPILDQELEATANSPKEALDIIRYLSAVEVACMKLEEIRERSLAIVRKSKKLEHLQTGLRQPAQATVDDHIRLLRQYNKTKDVGQQLIGMIAESRGVSLGDIYRDGDYGVNAED